MNKILTAPILGGKKAKTQDTVAKIKACDKNEPHRVYFCFLHYLIAIIKGMERECDQYQ